MNSNDFLSQDFIDELMPTELVNGIQEVLDQDQQFLINEILTANPQQQIYINDGLSDLSVAPQMSIMDQQQSQQPQGTYAIQGLGFQNHGQVAVVYNNSTNQHLVSHHGNVANQHLDITGQQMVVNSPQIVSNHVYGHDHLMSNQQMITEQNNLINQQRISNMQIASGHNLTMSDYMSAPTMGVHHESIGEAAFPDAVEQEVGQMGMTFLEDKDDEIFDCTPVEDDHISLTAPVVDGKQVKPKKPKGVKKKKDPNAPQAPMSAYSFFFKETQLKVKAANPSAKFGDVSRSVSILWERLEESQKAIYRKMQEQDKLRHTKEMVEYKISLGENKDSVAEPSSPPKKQPQSIRIVYSDGKLLNTTPAVQVQTKSHIHADTLLPEDKTVFQGDSLSTLKVTKGTPIDREETSNTCAKSGCTKFAVKCAEWEEDYCSYECAVTHCKHVFQTFVKNNLQGS